SSDSAHVRADGGLTVRTSGLNEAVILRPTDLTSDRAAISRRDVAGAYLAEWRTDGDLRLPDGCASSPSWTFINDQDTGIYRLSVNFIGFSASGTRRFAIGSSALQGDGSTGGIQIRSAPGSASTPDYTFVGDTDTGMYRGGTNILAFAT